MGAFTDKIKASFDAWIAKQNEERKKPKNPKRPKSIKDPIDVPQGGLYGGKQRKQLKDIEKDY